MYKILLFPGDGIGPEVTEQALRLIRKIGESFHLVFEIEEDLLGGCSIDRHGAPLTPEALKRAQNADAVYLGAVGGPKWDDVDPSLRPEKGLLALRKGLGAFANLRPVKVLGDLARISTLKEEVVRGLDFVIVRELTGGIYFGEPRGISTLADGRGEKGINTEVYTTPEIERIARKAFELARRRGRKVTSVDKANVLESSRLWRKVVVEVHKDYPDVTLDHRYVDDCAMQLIRNPRQFDVMVTTNMFGDILSDEAAMLTGSIGMLPSASVGAGAALYEPVHGSAPDIAGKNIANPLAAILSVAMMLEYSFNLHEVAHAVEKAVVKTLAEGFRTADIFEQGMNRVSCSDMGSRVLHNLSA
ncbi:MAG: 3-isopropylmalate dehydrogenase [Candidatus Omnitrophica bacterium]|nr:3-isopropylmalate dehydrogenase [Candidatus Omnitrophota bacterium]